MELFKNKVGRPSNATKRNRRIVVIVAVLAVVALFQSVIISYKNSKNDVSSKSSNIKVGEKKSGDVATAADYKKYDRKITEDDVSAIAKIASGVSIPGLTRQSYADIDGDGKVNDTDIKLAIRISTGYKRYQYGDVNKDGKVDMSDVRLMSRYLSGYKTDTIKDSVQKELADIDGNGKIDSSDARYITRMSSGYGDLCVARDTTKGDGKITQEDVDLMLEFAGGYKDKTYPQKLAADLNGNGKVTESDVRAVSNKITKFDNLFSTPSTTKNGVKITYDKKTGYLTLNGSAKSSIALMRLKAQKFVMNSEYTVKLSYVSGTVSSPNSYFDLDIKQNNNNSIKQRNYLNVVFPTKGSKTGTLKINSSASATGSQLYVWISKGKSNLTFKNYKIKVEITRKFGTKLVDKKRIQKNQIRKMNSLLKINPTKINNLNNYGNVQKMYTNNKLNIFNPGITQKQIGNLTIKYNPNNGFITINGTTTDSFVLASINGMRFHDNESISTTILYESGSFLVDSSHVTKDDYDVYESVKLNTEILGNTVISCTVDKNNPCSSNSTLPRNFSDIKSVRFKTMNEAITKGDSLYLYIDNENDLKITFEDYTIYIGLYDVISEPYSPVVRPGSDDSDIKPDSAPIYIPPSYSPSQYTTFSDGFTKLKYDLGAISRDIGTQSLQRCHSYSIAYGSYVLLGKKPEAISDSIPTVCAGEDCDNYGSQRFGGCADGECNNISITGYAEEYAVIVDKINAGIPVVIHTRGSYNGGQHWVLVVGYRTGVESINSESELLKNVWVIDPFHKNGYDYRADYNDPTFKLWEGIPVNENLGTTRNTCDFMYDYQIRTWNTRTSAK